MVRRFFSRALQAKREVWQCRGCGAEANAIVYLLTRGTLRAPAGDREAG